jgi:nucleoside-diphosphate-sugar epimerase
MYKFYQLNSMTLSKIKKPILITGGSGFIGSQLVNKLIKNNIEVNILLRKSSNIKKILRTKIHYVKIKKINFNNINEIEKYISVLKPKTIFHLASSGISEKRIYKKKLNEINFLFLKNFFNICIKYKFEIFINTGSVSEYGNSKLNIKFSEDKTYTNHSYYGISKLRGTNYISKKAKRKKLNTITIRPFYVYGPNENNNRLISVITEKMLNNMRISLPKNDTVFRDFIHIEDVINFYLKVASSKKTFHGEVFNLGTGDKTELVHIFKIIKKIIGYKLDPFFNYSLKEESNYSSVAYTKKTKKIFNFKSKINIKEGVVDTVKWRLRNIT